MVYGVVYMQNVPFDSNAMEDPLPSVLKHVTANSPEDAAIQAMVEDGITRSNPPASWMITVTPSVGPVYDNTNFLY